jgi:hypothetical protein
LHVRLLIANAAETLARFCALIVPASHRSKALANNGDQEHPIWAQGPQYLFEPHWKPNTAPDALGVRIHLARKRAPGFEAFVGRTGERGAHVAEAPWLFQMMRQAMGREELDDLHTAAALILGFLRRDDIAARRGINNLQGQTHMI